MNSPVTFNRPARNMRPGLATAALALCLLPQLSNAELVAYWDFNQTTPFGVSVDTRAGLAPRVLGGAAVTADGAGRSGSAGDRAMTFGLAQQRLHLADASYFTAAAAGDVLSVSFWIRHVTALRNATPLSFVAPSTLGGRGFQSHAPWGDGTIYFDTGGCCDGTMRTFINPGLGATWLSAWHHVALVKNGPAKDIYVDGTLRISGVNTAPIAVAFTEFFLGNAPNLGESLNGDLDEFAVYSHALTGPDAANLFAGASPLTLATAPTDSDGDGLPDMWELRFGVDLTQFSGGGADKDSDGLSDANEFLRGSNPTLGDSDADGFVDGVETNTGTWVSISDTGTSPTLADTDSDSLLDGYERNTGIYVSPTNAGTNPNTRDYDGDLVEDGVEVLYGSNPVNASSTPITPGVPTLLAWWQFNDDTNAPSPRDTRVGHAGTLLGASGYSADAEGGTGLAGDKALRITAAGGKMRLENAPWVNMATRLDKMTVCYWIKVTSQPACSAFWFTSPSAGGLRGSQAHCPYTPSTIYFDTAGCCTQNTTGPNQRLSGSVSTVWVNNWHHCVLLKDGAAKRIYIDGVQVITTAAGGTLAAPLPQDFTAFTVGADNGNASVLGWMDDFAIFAAPLSDQDITDLFTRAKTPLQIGTSPDADADGLADLWEYIYFPGDLTKLGPAPADYDVDGSTDVNELAKNTNPNDPDTDDDTLLDGVETGTGVWVSTSDRGTSPTKPDTDGDLLRDDVETNTHTYVSPSNTGTDPHVRDSDGDTFPDGEEVSYGSNPNITGSVPFTTGQSFLLALWTFNDTSNPAAANDVIAGFRGASTGNYALGDSPHGTPGDHSMRFTPNQSVTVDGSFINHAAPGDAFTICFWQKLNTVLASSSFWVTSPSAGAVSSFRGIQAHTPWSDNTIYFDHSGCCNPGIERINYTLPLDFTSAQWAQWHHLALRKNGSSKQIYMDGILLLDGSGIPLVNDLAALTIGGGNAGFMDGWIDDFAIFAGGLTHEQICRLYGGESPQTVLLPAPGGPFEVTNFRLLPADQIQLTWNSTPGCTYRVEMSDSLAGGSWSTVAAGIPSGGNITVTTITLPSGLSRVFLRVTEQ